MSGRIRVLVTARDVGAGHQSRAFVEAARARNFEFCVLAQQPAAQAFAGCELPWSAVEPSDAASRVTHALDACAPHFVLAGLSGFSSGVDEHALAGARARGIATGAIQDYWGYLGSAQRTALPDVFFVIDARARDLTLARTGSSVDAIVTGSPKHHAYAANVSGWAPPVEGATSQRVTFFLQPREVPGIVESSEIFLSAAAGLARPIDAVLRLHPADRDPAFYQSQVDRVCPSARVAEPDGPVEPELCRVDVVVTGFSTVGLDHNYLQAYSRTPLGCLCYLAADESMRRFMTDVIGSDRVPGTDAGMGVMSHSAQEFAGWLARAVADDDERARYARAVWRNLDTGGGSPADRIAAYIETAVSSRKSRSLQS